LGVDIDGVLWYNMGQGYISQKGGILAKKRVIAQVSEEFHERVMQKSQETGIPYAVVIRRALEWWVEGKLDPTQEPDAIKD